MAAAPKIEVLVRYDAIRILFNGALHLHIVRSKFLGCQSWMRAAEGKFCIEYTLAGGVLQCDYDEREKWQTILDGLAKIL